MTVAIICHGHGHGRIIEMRRRCFKKAEQCLVHGRPASEVRVASSSSRVLSQGKSICSSSRRRGATAALAGI
ncbi:hypothetical protein TYRP_012712 [Tyrophagus putrescentiae]|nr:hypothetical protein TYRP_012712 [Tyrophagus putrescentiae]